MSEGRSEERPIVQSARSGRCRSCGSTNMVTVGVLFEEAPISVQVCSDCESRTWTRDGAPVDLGDLLHAFRGTSRGR